MAGQRNHATSLLATISNNIVASGDLFGNSTNPNMALQRNLSTRVLDGAIGRCSSAV